MPDASRITALVGPTNTGKTHRAVERMLEHGSGMIGLPLRLLAREVYDKVSARIGEDRVALVTGEEQRIPRRPDYWISTTEAMPVERDVDFVAVDEVQLAATEQRGHVFTSRILSARGRKETWLMGAGTMRRLLGQLVPTAEIVEHPRLSSLKFAGKATLGRVPPRSAVVAFSLPHVYELAEKLRARKGGAAVVLGALSPRTRNAQVAMFQAGEVDYLVATDAVGMGLNLGVSHVAFASLRKFDGRAARPLEEAELAQIAGRAGRWIEDGTFGTLDPLDLPISVARDVEMHRFPSLQKIRWRNDRLEMSSIEALRESLAVMSPRPVLTPVHDAEDQRALELLLRDPEIVQLARAGGEEAVQRLWDVCTVPDFRKLLFEAHVGFLGELYKVMMERGGRLDDAWVEPRVAELGELGPGGADVETLTARIAATRVWTYIANRGSWLEDAPRWQEETRALEDRLSDALHQRLLARFVDARRANRPSRPAVSKPRARGSSRDVAAEAFADRNPHVDPAHPFAKLAALRSQMSGVSGADRESSRSLGSGGRGMADEIAEQVIAAEDRDLSFRSDGALLHGERVVGVLVRGPQIALPDARAQIDGHDLGAGARARLQRRLQAFVRGAVTELIPRESALAAGESSFAVRALIHALEPGLGTAPTAGLTEILAALTPEERARLDEERVKPGPWLTYAAAGVSTRALVARHALVRVFHPIAERLPLPPAGIVSFVPRPLGAMTGAIHLALGFPLIAGRAVRADVLDRVSRAVLEDLAAGEVEAPIDGGRYASRLGCDRKMATSIVRLLATRATRLDVAI